MTGAMPLFRPAAARPATDVLAEADTNRAVLDLLLDRDGLADGPYATLIGGGRQLRPAVRLAVRHPRADVRIAGAGALGEAEVPDAPALLLPLLEDEDAAVRDAAAAAVEARLAGLRAAVSDAEAGALSAAVLRGGPTRHAAARWLAAGSGPPDTAVRLLAERPDGRPILTDVLTAERHPRVVRLAFRLLRDRRPVRPAVAAAQRTDPAFLLPLLREVAARGAGSLPGLPPLDWLEDPGPALAGLPASVCGAAVSLADRRCEPAESRRAVRRVGAGARPGSRPAGGGGHAAGTAPGNPRRDAAAGRGVAGCRRRRLGRGAAGAGPPARLAGAAGRARAAPRSRGAKRGGGGRTGRGYIRSASAGTASVTRCTRPSPSTQASTVRPVASTVPPRFSS